MGKIFQMNHDRWEDWPEGDAPDTLGWILFAAGIVAIVIMVFWYTFGTFDITITDFNAARQFTERP